MRIIDITMTIRKDMPVYKNRDAKRPVHTIDMKIPPDTINESSLCLNLHTGTHIDSPFHMMADGYPTEFLPLEKLITPCHVYDLTGLENGIHREDLEKLPIKAGDFILLKTRNSFDETFRPDFISVKESGARFLVERQIKGIGIDGLSVESAQPGHETHLALLEKDIIILEGLALKDVAPGPYTMIALPLKISDADGAPARVVLIEGALDLA